MTAALVALPLVALAAAGTLTGAAAPSLLLQGNVVCQYWEWALAWLLAPSARRRPTRR